MIDLPTPETDALFCRNGYPVEVDSSKAMQLCEKLEQERDWVTEKFKLLEGCFKRAERERDEARAVANALADIAFKYLTSLLASTPHSKDAAHDKETQEVIAAIKRWKELKK